MCAWGLESGIRSPYYLSTPLYHLFIKYLLLSIFWKFPQLTYTRIFPRTKSHISVLTWPICILISCHNFTQGTEEMRGLLSLTSFLFVSMLCPMKLMNWLIQHTAHVYFLWCLLSLMLASFIFMLLIYRLPHMLKMDFFFLLFGSQDLPCLFFLQKDRTVFYSITLIFIIFWLNFLTFFIPVFAKFIW